MKKVDYLDFWAQDEEGNYYHICEGTGDNLLEEDIAEGYIDYIYYEVFFSLESIRENDEDDGGMVLLKVLYKDLTLRKIVSEVREMAGCEHLKVLE